MTNSQYPLGIDISKWNYSPDLKTKPDFDKMARAGVKFIGIKAGESWGYEDPAFLNSWEESKRVGLARIAYFFPYFDQSPEPQVRNLLHITESAGAVWDRDRIALDLELHRGQGKARITNVTCETMERLKSITGRYPILYSRANWVNTYMVLNELLKNADWWLAHYLAPLPAPQYTPEKKCPPLLPKGVSSWLIHQTGEKGNGGAVGTVSYYVDINRWNGSLQDMYAYFGMSEPVEPPEDPPVVIIEPPEGETPDPPVGADEPKPRPLYKAKAIETPRQRAIVRSSPNGRFVRWLKSGDIVNVYQELASWVRIGVGEWMMKRWIERLNERPDLLPVPLYSQRDPRWENDLMGSSGITLGEQGCLVTATAAGLSYLLGETITPKEYNELASTQGGFEPPNHMYWLFPEHIWEGRIARTEYRWFANGVYWETMASSILSDNRPVWAQVDFDPKTPTVEQHWVLLIGLDDNGVWWCYDPWIGSTFALKSRYSKVFRVVGYRRQS